MSHKCDWKHRAYATDHGGPSAGPFWPSGGMAQSRACGRWWMLGPFGMAAMIIGFIVWWPLGLGLLFLNIYKRKGGDMPLTDVFDRMRAPFAGSPSATGNEAFNDWRRAEIERIEREREKLAEAEREFAMFVAELRRAKDREEFDRFMQARRAGSPDGTTAA